MTKDHDTKRALLLGAYGQSNLGDDLLLYNYLRLLTSRGYGSIAVNVSRAELIPDLIKQEFPTLETFDTYDISKYRLIRLIMSSDIVVYGGGTVYKELYKTTGRSRYSLILRILIFNAIAVVLGKKVYHLHIGIGVLKTRIGRLITKFCLYPARYTLFRDNESYNFARTVLRLPTKSLDVSTDVLFIDPTWTHVWHQRELPITSKQYKSVIGVNVLHDVPEWIDQPTYIGVVRSFIRQQTEAGHGVVLLPFQHDFNEHNDYKFMRDNFGDLDDCVVVESIELDLIGSYLDQLDVFIAMRFHSLLLATAINTPYLAISYDPKCTRFVQENSYEHVLALEDLTLEALTAAYSRVVDDRAGVIVQLEGMAKKNFDHAREWLAGFDLP